MNKNLLPIGSVISLKDATRKLMIIGLGIKLADADTVYDYIGLPFPEGYIDSEKMFLFNAEDLNEVHFLGYVNAETQVYLNKCAAQLDKKEEAVKE